MTKEDADPRTAGVRVEARMFLAVAAFVAVAGALYWSLSYEDAGTTLLALTAGMALFVGAYLVLQARKHPDAAEHHVAAESGSRPNAGHAHEYLPEASIWPFWIGVGAFVALAGLVLGYWALVPGGIVTGGATLGYVRQSRRRD